MRGADRAAGVELVRGQTHSTSLRSAQGDKVGAEAFFAFVRGEARRDGF